MFFLAAAAVALATAAFALLVPALVFAAECVLGCLRWPEREQLATQPPARVAVLIPAHNEEAGIGPTVANLAGQLGERDRIVVIADNCQDGTAAAARATAIPIGGPVVTALERTDEARRGKGYALAYGLAHLEPDPPEVVIFVDADCQVVDSHLRRLCQQVADTQRPVQADYLLHAAKEASPMGAIGALAILVRNRVRPRGLARLGFPCQLTGSGMGLPWALCGYVGRLQSNIVEDLVLGLELALAGHLPMACPDVLVVSELPVSRKDVSQQRRRWEHGQMATLLRYAPRLIGRAIVTWDPGLLAMGLDLAVPPLALFVMMQGLLFSLALVLVCASASPVPLVVSAVSLGLVGLGVITAWWTHARTQVPARRLLLAPFYVLWKIPLYATFLVKRETKWKRTRRPGDVPP